MISVEEALKLVLTDLQSVPRERVPLGRALGRVLGEQAVAPHALPPFANSAMDGFAARAADLQTATATSPVRLRVIGDLPAGSSERLIVKGGEAARITTGAPLPQGADCVVPVENTTEPRDMAAAPLPEHVLVVETVGPGDFVRRPGQDVESGALALESGTRLRPPEICLLAALGLDPVSVHRRPKVGVLSTGSELHAAGEGLGFGKIHDANGPSLCAAVEAAGAQPVSLGIAPDDSQAVIKALDRGAAEGLDVLVTSAGVSVGSRDYVRLAVERHGHIGFWRVNMRPGKPVVWGSYRGVPFFGLAGNPVSALVGFELFVRPALLALSGSRTVRKGRLTVQLGEAIESDGRESYLRAIVRQQEEGLRAWLTGDQGSGIISSLTAANALVILPSGMQRLEAGQRVEAIGLEGFWDRLGLTEVQA
jgi:molybdopterin molybdotransferase